VIKVATVSFLASWIASGNSSEKDIHNIAPAANPNHIGRNGAKKSTKRNAGIAINGCGREENILRSPAFHRGMPLGTIVAEIAIHSGILCRASAIAIKIPNASLGPKDTHIATHSENECNVITPNMRSALLASAHESMSIERLSYFWSFCSDRRIKYSHTNTHTATHRTTYGIPR